jgi:hypothetical protein
MVNNTPTLILFSVLTLGLAIITLLVPRWIIANFYRWTRFLYKGLKQEYPPNLEEDYRLLTSDPNAYYKKYSVQLKMFRLNGIFLILLFLFGICLFSTQ